MAIRDVFKVSRKTFFNPSEWLDFENLRALNVSFLAIFKNTFTAPKATYQETFAEAMVRLKLTEADVDAMAVRYRRYAMLFAFFGLLVFYYAFYLVFRYGTFSGLLLGLAASGLFVVNAYRYEFWSFQIRERRLGCTFTEWKRSIFGEKDIKS